MHPLGPRLPLLLSLVPAFALAALSPPGPFDLSVPARGFDERCFELAAGESLRYRFAASAPVDFNIHFHRGKEVVMPVRIDATRGHAATFTAPHADAYCLMWERGAGEAARVEGTVERVVR